MSDPEAGTPFRIALDDGVLKRFDRLVTPQNEQERSNIRLRLLRAGYRRPSAVRVFYATRAALALGFAFVSLIAVPLLAERLPLALIGLFIFLPTTIGYLLPGLWIERQFQRRQEAAQLGFPDTLDMLLICIEAGQGIDQACRRVAREIHKSNPVLSEELKIVNDELWAGKERARVFRDFAERLGVPDIAAFATVLKQSDEFGVSIAETLRIYAAEMRNKRIMRAEEKANLMPVKVALGSILFTVPPTMLIMAGPSLIMMLRVFGGAHH